MLADSYELAPLTLRERTAIDNLAVARALGHQPGCMHRQCAEARAALGGLLDQGERFVSQYTAPQLAALARRGFVHLPPGDQQ